jgi:hypothetical protein
MCLKSVLKHLPLLNLFSAKSFFQKNVFIITTEVLTISSFYFPGTNCGDQRSFSPESFDYVVSTCALWGSGQSWKDTISTAFYSLKPEGTLLLSEFKNHLPQHLNLGGAGIESSFPILKAANCRSELAKLNKDFVAMKCKKDDYEAKELLSCISDR